MVDFSVIIPLFNKGPHIKRALDSVISQTRKPKEIIVVDDKSTDDGPLIVKSFDSDLLRYFQRDTPGPGGYAARNMGIRKATGDWIAFLDADDAWTSGHLQAIQKYLTAENEAGDVVCSFTGYEVVQPNGHRYPNQVTRQLKPDSPPVVLEFAQFLRLWIRNRGSPIWTSAAAASRQALLDAGLFPEGRCRRGGDKDMWLRVTALGQTVLCPVTTAIYHRDSVNMVTTQNKTNIRHCICSTLEAMEAKEICDPVLIRKLFNIEVFNYALYATGSGRVDPAVWSGFHRDMDPFKYLVMRAISTTPGAAFVNSARKLWKAIQGRS